MIIGLCNRPFSSVEEMDSAMIDAWNEVVSDNDIVYHLGDFCFGSDDYAEYIFNQLNGRKILVLGNHDIDRDGNALKKIADLNWHKPPAHAVYTRDEGQYLYLSHYAHRVWPSSNYNNSYHFYGHSHDMLYQNGLSRDVGVDSADVNFRPRTFKQLTQGLKPLINNYNS